MKNSKAFLQQRRKIHSANQLKIISTRFYEHVILQMLIVVRDFVLCTNNKENKKEIKNHHKALIRILKINTRNAKTLIIN